MAKVSSIDPVAKPWGYEFSFFENEEMSIWILQLGSNHKSGYLLESARTSMHMHLRKTATAICAFGEVRLNSDICDTTLVKGEFATIQPFCHHRLEAKVGASIVIEIETPNCREDIIRKDDDYGRVEEGYVWERPQFWDRELIKLVNNGEDLEVSSEIVIRKCTFNLKKSYKDSQLFIPVETTPLPCLQTELRAGMVYWGKVLYEAIERSGADNINIEGYLVF